MNAINIEQTANQTQLAFRVNQNAAISGIRLARARLGGNLPGEPRKGSIMVSMTFKARAVEGPEGLLRLEVEFRISGADGSAHSPEAGRPRNVVAVECVFEVNYELREGFQPSREEIRAFKDGNAIFNCWPYFREYLQSSLQRMGFPQLTVPLLRLRPKAPKVGSLSGSEYDTENAMPAIERTQTNERQSK